MALTLLEGASVQGGQPPEGQSDILFVTGQHNWIHQGRWVLNSARIAAVWGAKKSICSSAQSPGNLRRKVVLSAARHSVRTFHAL